MPRIRDLVAAAKEADDHKAIASAALAEASHVDEQATADVAATHYRVVHALQAAGRPFVDVTASPPLLYTPLPDGSDFAATPIGSLDDDLDF
ncbi:MAG: hypothetical protein U0790_00125 [Isosphaeraceae bacterium]